MSEKVEKGKLYLIANTTPTSIFRVRATGEFRTPKQDEWFLSGAKVEAYKAYTNLTHEYHIGELVKGKLVTQWVPES